MCEDRLTEGVTQTLTLTPGSLESSPISNTYCGVSLGKSPALSVPQSPICKTRLIIVSACSECFEALVCEICAWHLMSNPGRHLSCLTRILGRGDRGGLSQSRLGLEEASFSVLASFSEPPFPSLQVGKLRPGKRKQMCPAPASQCDCEQGRPPHVQLGFP